MLSSGLRLSGEEKYGRPYTKPDAKPYTLGDDLSSRQDFLKQYKETIADELKRTPSDPKLIKDQTWVNTEIQIDRAKELEKTSWLYSAKSGLRNVTDFFLVVGEISGFLLAGILTIVGKLDPGAIFLGWTTSSILVATSAAYAIQELYDLWNNTQIEQRNIRYAASFAKLAFSVFVTCMALISVPIINLSMAAVLGTVLVDYLKNYAIHNRINAEIETLKGKITEKQAALTEKVREVLDSNWIEPRKILQNSTVKLLAFELYTHRKQLDKLKKESECSDINKISLNTALFGFSFLFLSTAFFPAAIVLHILCLAAIFCGWIMSKGISLVMQEGDLRNLNNELQQPDLSEEETSIRRDIRNIESEHMRAVAAVRASRASTTVEAVRASLASTTASRTRPSNAPEIASPEPGTGRNNFFSPPPTDACKDDDQKSSPSYCY